MTAKSNGSQRFFRSGNSLSRPRTREARQSQCRSPQLLALHERSYDNQKRKEAFAAYGFEKGLDFLAEPTHDPTLTEFAQKVGLHAVLVPLVLAGLCT